MSFSVSMLIARVVFVTAVALSGGQGLLQGADLEQARQAHAEALADRGAAVDRRDELEQGYRALLLEIDRLKRSPDTLQVRAELRSMLKESRRWAGRLRDVEATVRQKEARLRQLSGLIVDVVDGEISGLEASLAGAPAGSRARVVARLNELRRLRARYTQSLPSAPSERVLHDTLEVTAPDDLLAAADELRDAEDQIRARLAALEERLGELRRARRVAQRARQFAAEEGFFDETDRAQFVAGWSAAGRTAEAGQGEAVDSAAEMPAGGQGFAAASNDAESTASPGGSFEPPSSSPQPADVSAPLPSGPGDTLRPDAAIDAEAMLGEPRVEGAALDGQIEGLQQEYDRLEQRARRLDSRARELRRRAEALLE